MLNFLHNNSFKNLKIALNSKIFVHFRFHEYIEILKKFVGIKLLNSKKYNFLSEEKSVNVNSSNPYIPYSLRGPLAS